MASLNLFSKNSSPAELAGELKGKCVGYVTENLEDDFWQSEFGQELVDKTDIGDVSEGGDSLVEGQAWIRQMDNYILYGGTEDGHKVLDEIIASANLNSQEKEILTEWRDRAFPSIFEIREVTAGKLKAMDLLAEANYDIYFNDVVKGQEAAKGMPAGSFVQTNILPVKGIWFFSGVQRVLPKEAELLIFQTYVANAPARQAFRNNPEKLRQALKFQKEHYQIFVDRFGTDELIVPFQQAREKLQEYYDSLPGSFGKSDNKIIVPKLSEDFQDAETIGIVMDKREGQHEFKDYGKFVKIFETGNISKKAREFVMDYLEDETLPAFVFRRMKERYPENFYKVMMETTSRADRRLYPINDFDRLMDIFKPGWRENYPAIIPLNQRFEKYYYNLGRNDLCYCGSGKKFKKCHGK